MSKIPILNKKYIFLQNVFYQSIQSLKVSNKRKMMVEKKNNPKEKHLYNSLHNTKGPAIEIPDPRFKKYFPFVYYLYGVPYTHQEYLDALFLLGID